MNKLITEVNNAVEKFIAEKQIVIQNTSIYVSIFSNMGNGFARRISASESPRSKKEFFDALEEYDELCIKGVK